MSSCLSESRHRAEDKPHNPDFLYIFHVSPFGFGFVSQNKDFSAAGFLLDEGLNMSNNFRLGDQAHERVPSRILTWEY